MWVTQKEQKFIFIPREVKIIIMFPAVLNNQEHFYSTLYYNSEIWLLPSLKSQLKQSLLSVSSKALKLCMFYPDRMTSFERIHEINKRATPTEITIYKLAIQLFKLYDTPLPTQEWSHLNQNQFFTSRQTTFMSHKTKTYKVGLNALANRLTSLNGKIPLEWLNLSTSHTK